MSKLPTSRGAHLPVFDPSTVSMSSDSDSDNSSSDSDTDVAPTPAPVLPARAVIPGSLFGPASGSDSSSSSDEEEEEAAPIQAKGKVVVPPSSSSRPSAAGATSTPARASRPSPIVDGYHFHGKPHDTVRLGDSFYINSHCYVAVSLPSGRIPDAPNPSHRKIVNPLPHWATPLASAENSFHFLGRKLDAIREERPLANDDDFESFVVTESGTVVLMNLVNSMTLTKTIHPPQKRGGFGKKLQEDVLAVNNVNWHMNKKAILPGEPAVMTYVARNVLVPVPLWRKFKDPARARAAAAREQHQQHAEDGPSLPKPPTLKRNASSIDNSSGLIAMAKEYCATRVPVLVKMLAAKSPGMSQLVAFDRWKAMERKMLLEGPSATVAAHKETLDGILAKRYHTGIANKTISTASEFAAQTLARFVLLTNPAASVALTELEARLREEDARTAAVSDDVDLE